MNWKNNAGNYISQQQIIYILQIKEKVRSGVLKAKGLNNPACMLVAKFARRFTLARCLEMINATCAINAHAITRDRRR